MALMTTPKGVAIWPKLNEPDTKYKAEGVYEVKLAFDANDPALEPIRTKIDETIEAAYQEQVDKLTEQGKKGLIAKLKKADSPIKVEEDEETGEETGRVILKFKMQASGISKKTGKPWKRKPDIFNARGVQLKNPPKIGGGSVLKVSFEAAPYYAPNEKACGCTLRLEGVQIIQLVSFGQRDAGGHGFGAEEGYDGEGLEDDELTGGANDGADGDDDDDM